uniref:nucleoside-diphosphate kinase n=1 Tax=Chelydra serpentina TaxID=8475 RepID=A0A8C3SLB4_CHESE
DELDFLLPVALQNSGIQPSEQGGVPKRHFQSGLFWPLEQASEDLLKEHYIALCDRPFYSRLVEYMRSGPIVAMVWQGLDVVKTARAMIGETNLANPDPAPSEGTSALKSASESLGFVFHCKRTFLQTVKFNWQGRPASQNRGPRISLGSFKFTPQISKLRYPQF